MQRNRMREREREFRDRDRKEIITTHYSCSLVAN